MQPHKKVATNTTGGSGNGRDSQSATGGHKGSKGGDMSGHKNKYVQGSDWHKINVNTKDSHVGKAVQPTVLPKPRYKEIKNCSEVDCNWIMTQHEPNGRWNGKHADKYKYFVAKCADCAGTGGYRKHPCKVQPKVDIK
ncbi:hypothetical protein SARC_01843 [Sphaeroforma arctica JP610]|uniref:Uncharacterized protein n=1 Tax=Sphaeroforma arctica JP610 TaxID=667725 RepID=A0A0L0GCM5_9EUKA|nr:hypothetical protein SARC_01843 [Sphaeroforma arctica JP610]KNC85998.1 hypothetical protein SARC_01843 [Sphaeroforma arctica JP610]|eukprot:XP_014159900.1 hypothetical protein SARC_01843 [Sphaeroforma arctica JP610]